MRYETRELSTRELDVVVGGDQAFYGSNCGVSTDDLLGIASNVAKAIPVVGGALDDLVTKVGHKICG